MKIVLSCNSAWGKGGQGNFINRATSGLDKLGAVSIYCAKGNHSPQEKQRVTQIESTRTTALLKKSPILRRRKDLITFSSDFSFDTKVSRSLNANNIKPDLFVGVAMHCALTMQSVRRAGSKTLLYCLNAYIPYVKSQVDREYRSLDETGGSIHRLSIRRFLRECALADAVIVNSSFAERTFRDAGMTEKPIHVINPVVNSDRFRPIADRQTTPKLSIIYIGAVTPRKGLDYLCQAFEELDTDSFHLTIVGGASTRRSGALIDRMKRLPNVTQAIYNFGVDDPSPIIGAADVLVLPSIEDGFGVVALEAMACGVTVIVTDQCGATDAVIHGANGFIVPARDARAIASKLRWMRNNPADLERMKRECRETALRFSQDRYNEELRKAVEATLS